MVIGPDKQLAVEPEEKFVPKNATAAVVHLQDWVSPSFHCKDTSLCELLCGNVTIDRNKKYECYSPLKCLMNNALTDTIP